MTVRPSRRRPPGPGPEQAVRLAVLGLGVFLAASLSLAFRHGGAERAAPVWLANALTVAFLVKQGPRRWPAMLAAALAGNLAADLIAGASLALAFSLSACNALEAGLCASLIGRLAGPAPDLSRRRDLVAFLGAAAVSTAASALAATGLLRLFGQESAAADLAVWVLADGLGLVVVTPVLLMLDDVRAQLLVRRPPPRRFLSLAVLTAGTLAAFALGPYPVLFVVAPLWAYAAAELEFLGLCAGAVIVGTIAIGMTGLGLGPVARPPAGEVEHILLVQAFLAFTTLTLMGFTTGVAHRRRLTETLDQLRREAEGRRAGAVEDRRRAQMAESIAGLGYWRMDLKTGAMDWSPQIHVLCGFPRSQAPDRAALRRLLHPEDVPAADAMFERLVATGEPQLLEVRIVTADGRPRVIRSWATVEHDEFGEIAAVLYALVDVTEQRRVEAELRQARDAAEQAAEVKAEFLANMSHELRTPLTSILGFTALAAADGELPDSARRYIDRIGTSSKALLTLVNDVLDFSKLEAGEIRLEPRPVDVADLGREVLSMFGDQAEAKGLAVALDLADGIPPALAADSDRVRQVLINLVGNAVKFTAAGQVTLQVGYDAEAELLGVSVVDTGPGVSADRRSQLFQRFSQVDGSSTRTFGGTGLGLAICKGLIEAMRGEIGVDTEEGRGSRFWFEIPARAVDPVQAATATAAAAALGLGNRFLVVDDNRANRELVRTILTSLGADIVEAEDGYAGVQAAMELPFDVILMDMRMPGLSGEQAVAEIRRGGPNANSPIIAFSASADPGRLEPLRRMGFDSCLPKPFTLNDLIRAVETALDACQSQSPVRAHG